MKSHHAKLLQSYLTVCFPVDHSLPGSSVHGILQVRTLEWVTMPSSRGSAPSIPVSVSRWSCGAQRVLAAEVGLKSHGPCTSHGTPEKLWGPECLPWLSEFQAHEMHTCELIFPSFLSSRGGGIELNLSFTQKCPSFVAYRLRTQIGESL